MKGFTITLDNRYFLVRFYHAPEKNTTVCVLEDLWAEDIYRGKARCNTRDGDIYSHREGEKISLQRAINKFVKKNCRVIKKIYNDNLEEISRIDTGLFIAWERRKLKEKEK